MILREAAFFFLPCKRDLKGKAHKKREKFQLSDSLRPPEKATANRTEPYGISDTLSSAYSRRGNVTNKRQSRPRRLSKHFYGKCALKRSSAPRRSQAHGSGNTIFTSLQKRGKGDTLFVYLVRIAGVVVPRDLYKGEAMLNHALRNSVPDL